MTDKQTPTPFPGKAEFGTAPYSDGSGFHATVGYDLTDGSYYRHQIRIGGDYTVTVPVEHAEALIAAIRYCADALLADRDASITKATGATDQ